MLPQQPYLPPAPPTSQMSVAQSSSMILSQQEGGLGSTLAIDNDQVFEAYSKVSSILIPGGGGGRPKRFL